MVFIQVRPVFVDDVQQLLILTWEKFRAPEGQGYAGRFRYTKSIRVHDLEFNPLARIKCEEFWSDHELQQMCETSVMQVDHVIFYFKREYDQEQEILKPKMIYSLFDLDREKQESASGPRVTQPRSHLQLYRCTILRDEEAGIHEEPLPFRFDEGQDKFSPIFFQRFDQDEVA